MRSAILGWPQCSHCLNATLCARAMAHDSCHESEAARQAQPAHAALQPPAAAHLQPLVRLQHPHGCMGALRARFALAHLQRLIHAQHLWAGRGSAGPLSTPPRHAVPQPCSQPSWLPANAHAPHHLQLLPWPRDCGLNGLHGRCRLPLAPPARGPLLHGLARGKCKAGSHGQCTWARMRHAHACAAAHSPRGPRTLPQSPPAPAPGSAPLQPRRAALLLCWNSNGASVTISEPPACSVSTAIVCTNRPGSSALAPSSMLRCGGLGGTALWRAQPLPCRSFSPAAPRRTFRPRAVAHAAAGPGNGGSHCLQASCSHWQRRSAACA